MGKLLRIRDYILIAGALAGEVFEEIRLAGGLLPSLMQERYGFIPSRYKRNSYLSTVSQMLSTGDICRTVDKKAKVYIELTSAGKREVKRRFPLLWLQAEKWDGLFMLVIFDIPEKARVTRAKLRGKLTELGFGMLQESVWISPYHFEDDLREFLVANGLKDQVFVLAARKLWAGDMQKLAERVWKLEKVNEGYNKVIKLADKSKTRAYSLYLETLSQDPLLPRELLPEYWSRERAIKLLS